MKFSIITATFNSANFVADALASVHRQSHGDIEQVVVDGASRDGTMDIVHGCERRPGPVISEPDRGIYDGLNKGIAAASGEVIGFLHSDDVLASPEIIATVADVFASGNVDGVYGDLQYVGQGDLSRVVRYWRGRPFNPDLLKQGWMPAHPTLYLRREVYERHGGFDTQFRIAADYDFILRVMADRSLRFAYLPQVMVKMRTGGASNRSLANILQKTREDWHALRRNHAGGVGALLGKNLRKIPQFFAG